MDKVKHGRIIIFAAQGKPSSWRTQYEISSGFLASSSRKEQIVDAIFVLRKNKNKDKSEGIFYELFILKDRHGLNHFGQVIAELKLKNGYFEVSIPEISG